MDGRRIMEIQLQLGPFHIKSSKRDNPIRNVVCKMESNRIEKL